LTILAPDHEVYRQRISSLIAPGVDGYFGVLARHAPMVAALATGELSLADDQGRRQFFALGGGFLEVAWDEVTVLADTAEPAVEIDVARAHEAENRARRRLASRDSDLDVARAEGALRRALNRLRVAEKRQQRT
jgi:F-type H+-transporting ATPase subunit epsilon